MNDVTITFELDTPGGGSPVFGVRNMGASPKMTDVRINATVSQDAPLTGVYSMGGGCAVALYTRSGAMVRIDHSVISGDGFSIDAGPPTGGEHLIGMSKLVGNVQGSNFECLGSYTEDPSGDLRELSPSCN
jgi:uncharacterized protein with ACT and thioredoxin-like domain